MKIFPTGINTRSLSSKTYPCVTYARTTKTNYLSILNLVLIWSMAVPDTPQSFRYLTCFYLPYGRQSTYLTNIKYLAIAEAIPTSIPFLPNAAPDSCSMISYLPTYLPIFVPSNSAPKVIHWKEGDREVRQQKSQVTGTPSESLPSLSGLLSSPYHTNTCEWKRSRW